MDNRVSSVLILNGYHSVTENSKLVRHIDLSCIIVMFAQEYCIYTIDQEHVYLFV